MNLIYIQPHFNSNRNYDGGQSGTDFWGETKAKRAFEDRHQNTTAYPAAVGSCREIYA